MNNNQISDQDIEHYLQGKDELSSTYSESKELKTPRHLDRKIKKIAQEADQESKSRSWFLPLSFAATIVIAVTITFLFNSKGVEEPNLLVESKENSQEKPVSNAKKVDLPKKIHTAEPKSYQQNRKENVADIDDKFELPSHLKEMIQPTHAGSDIELPPDEILKGWSKKQWRQQIQELQKAGNTALADKYVQQFANYFPDQKIYLSK